MATNLTEEFDWDEEASYFSDLENRIENNFENLIFKLMQRRDIILNDLRRLREEFTFNQRSELMNLVKMKKSYGEMNTLLGDLEADTARDGMTSVLLDLNEKIEALEKLLRKRLCDISFSFTTDEFNLCLTRLGLLSKKTMEAHLGRNYAEITGPMVRFGRHGKKKGMFSSPRGIYIDPDQERIFVADGKNSRIQVWTISGDYLMEFGKKYLKQPWGVCIGDDCLFISDFDLNAVFKFSLDDFKLVSRTNSKRGINPGQLSSPAGLAVDGESLYLTEHGNNRISIYSVDLVYDRIFGKGLLEHPMCVKLNDKFVLVSEMEGLIKTFSKEGRLVRVLKRGLIFSNYVSYFCIDNYGNLLVCDRKRNSILILTQEGKLILSINTSNWGCESPFAVEISKDEKIVCSLQGRAYSVIVL